METPRRSSTSAQIVEKPTYGIDSKVGFSTISAVKEGWDGWLAVFQEVRDANGREALAVFIRADDFVDAH